MTITIVLVAFAAYVIGLFQGWFAAQRDAEERAVDAKRNPFYGLYKTRYEQDALDDLVVKEIAQKAAAARWGARSAK